MSPSKLPGLPGLHWSQRQQQQQEQQQQQQQQQQQLQQAQQLPSDKAAINDTFDVPEVCGSHPQQSERRRLWELASSKYFDKQHRDFFFFFWVTRDMPCSDGKIRVTEISRFVQEQRPKHRVSKRPLQTIPFGASKGF